MTLIQGNEEQLVVIKANVTELLGSPTSSPCDWNDVTALLGRVPSHGNVDEEDPNGRLLLSTLIRKNPPVAVLEAALRAFPEALNQNPAAFFTACRDASSEVLVTMIRHCVKTRKSTECPYPWLISCHVSMEGAKSLIEAYPQGVLEESRFLSGHNLLDYFLMSDDMVEQRRFDVTLWNKFKLVLLAAEYARGGSSLLPVHTIIRRVVSQPGKLLCAYQ